MENIWGSRQVLAISPSNLTVPLAILIPTQFSATYNVKLHPRSSVLTNTEWLVSIVMQPVSLLMPAASAVEAPEQFTSETDDVSTCQ